MLLINLNQDKSEFNSYISNTLLENIKKSLNLNKKIILYLNKRWEYSSLICENCNYLYKCDNCDVSMIVHKYPEKLICHICNNSKNIPKKCIKCNNETLKKVWIWTQQIEDFLKKYFPENKVFRFDTDVIKNKTEKNNALENIEKSDIIIWTKMITTWYDFRWIWTIWVILLEQELLIPKYDTEEKVYQNIKQLIWRWNRRWEKTDILIQTFIPENQIIKNIFESNYKEYFIKTLEERKIFNYPPYSEMIILEYRDKDIKKTKEFIEKLKIKLDKENEKKQDKNIEIILNSNSIKRNNSYHSKIILKWKNIREFLKCIKNEILKIPNLVVIFE